MHAQKYLLYKIYIGPTVFFLNLIYQDVNVYFCGTLLPTVLHFGLPRLVLRFYLPLGAAVAPAGNPGGWEGLHMASVAPAGNPGGWEGLHMASVAPAGNPGGWEGLHMASSS